MANTLAELLKQRTRNIGFAGEEGDMLNMSSSGFNPAGVMITNQSLGYGPEGAENVSFRGSVNQSPEAILQGYKDRTTGDYVLRHPTDPNQFGRVPASVIQSEQARLMREQDRQRKIAEFEDLKRRKMEAEIGELNARADASMAKGGGSDKAIPQGMAVTSTGQIVPQRIADSQDALMLLQEAAPLVRKSTGSGVGAGADWLAGMVGYSTEGAENSARLKAIGGQLIAKMPKMSGPQSDKDVQLYREMAGQIGDPTIPSGVKEAAMKTIAELQAKYAGVQTPQLQFGEQQQSSGFGDEGKEARYQAWKAQQGAR